MALDDAKKPPRLFFRFTNEVDGVMHTVAALPDEMTEPIRAGDTVIVWDVPHVVTDADEGRQRVLCTCDPSVWKGAHGLR